MNGLKCDNCKKETSPIYRFVIKVLKIKWVCWRCLNELEAEGYKQKLSTDSFTFG